MPSASQSIRRPTSFSNLEAPAATALLAVLLLSCGPGGRGPAVGANDEVTLIVGEGIPESAPALLERTLGEEIRYARSEPLFRVERIAASGLENAKNHKSVVLLANLNVPGRAARAAREILTEEQLSNASSHHGVIAPLDDVWVPGQTVIVLASTDAEGTLALVEERAGRIREVMISSTKERLARYLYKDGENPAEAKRLASEQGWSLRVPSRDWRLETTSDPGRLVRLRATEPARVLSVYWVPADSVPLEPASALGLRDGFGARFDGGATVDRDRSTVTEGRFLGHHALFIRGAWSNAREAHGGALQSILFVDPARERLYLIDGLAYAPSADLKLWMWQLEALANTFRLAS